jgi:hypothetical protein
MEISVMTNYNIKQSIELMIHKVVNKLKRLESRSVSSMTRKYSYPAMINKSNHNSIHLENPNEYVKNQYKDGPKKE